MNAKNQIYLRVQFAALLLAGMLMLLAEIVRLR